MKKILRVFSKESLTTMNIMVFVIDKCNYECSYCINRRPRTNQKIDFEKLHVFIQNIKKKTDKTINIMFFGGEPTLHDGLIDFIIKIKDESRITSELLTNFSNTVDYYKTVSDNGCNLIVTYHYRGVKHREQFIDKLNSYISSYGLNKLALIKIMLTPNDFDECVKTYEQIRKINTELNVSANLLDDFSMNTDENPQYSAAQLEKYFMLHNVDDDKNLTVVYDDGTDEEMNINEFRKYGLTSFKNWKCFCGKDFLFIDVNGDIRKCIHSNPIHNIGHPLDVFKLKPMICTYYTCPCGMDVEKERIFK